MSKPDKFPEQSQEQPGKQFKMNPIPEVIRNNYKGSGKLTDKVAFITGGDSGIGRSVAVHFAREGANVAIVYLKENQDAIKTKELVENEGRQCLLIAGDVQDSNFCKNAVSICIKTFSKIRIIPKQE